MQQFFTRAKANEGIDLDLTLPDGTPTEYKIRIRGRDSDEFRKAEAESKRRLFVAIQDAKAKKNTDAITKLKSDEERLSLLSALIVSWTLPDECNEDNKRKLLIEAPQIADEIDRLASDRSLFFAKGSTNSEPMPAPSLN